MDLIILLVASLMLSFLSSESLSLDNSTKIFDIKDYGAVDDGQTNSTHAFLQAWSDACAWEGGSPTLLVPEGMFLVGPLLLGGPCVGPLVVQVNGTVLASSDLSLYGRATEWIKFRKVDGMLVTGAGKFDGQGSAVWSLNDCDDENKTKNCKKLPWSINFSKVTNSTIEGISSINSKGFHIMVHGSSNLNLQSITILAPAGSPNTDGIHLSQSANINISHCTIATGDDCISIGPGTSNLTVSGVLCGPGHGISVGSLGALANESVVADITVRNCTLNGTDNGVRVKTWQESPTKSVARNFLFEDIVMVDVENPIIINQKYCPTSACSNKSPSLVKISDVKFRNITGNSRTKTAISLICSDAVPCEGIELSNISLQYHNANSSIDGTVVEAGNSTCMNVKGFSSGIVIPESCI